MQTDDFVMEESYSKTVLGPVQLDTHELWHMQLVHLFTTISDTGFQTPHMTSGCVYASSFQKILSSNHQWLLDLFLYKIF